MSTINLGNGQRRERAQLPLRLAEASQPNSRRGEQGAAAEGNNNGHGNRGKDNNDGDDSNNDSHNGDGDDHSDSDDGDFGWRDGQRATNVGLVQTVRGREPGHTGSDEGLVSSIPWTATEGHRGCRVRRTSGVVVCVRPALEPDEGSWGRLCRLAQSP
ncbi:hypothetical protein F443_16645 [Phytophthora nicotianae P1569]|uniref:Uncharacterized protein n=1 Tax=Phytophthora nicotianae P1569 TaxID=1317065 RepID=V9EEE6_PHYNI|nr:hypothetical protein F443_16645 [Phytophthora nicotianae P1569]